MADDTFDESFVIDQDELCDYISGKLDIDADTVSTVLDAEMEFLESKGLVFEEKSGGPEKQADVPMGEIDAHELTSFVVSNTGLAEKLVNQILDTETAYLEKRGVAEPKTGF